MVEKKKTTTTTTTTVATGHATACVIEGGVHTRTGRLVSELQRCKEPYGTARHWHKHDPTPTAGRTWLINTKAINHCVGLYLGAPQVGGG